VNDVSEQRALRILSTTAADIKLNPDVLNLPATV
jgi:hypothetical protein